MNENNSKKIIAGTVLILVLVGIYFWFNRGEADVNTPENATLWFCVPCGKPFELTGQQLTADVRSVERTVGEEAPSEPGEAHPRGRGDKRVFSVAKCPLCKKWTGEAARKCPDCGEIFLARTKKGQPAYCSKCLWDPHTGGKAEGDRLTEGRD